MCTLLLMVAGVFQRSLWNLRAQETGYREEGLLVADVEMWPPGESSEARRDEVFEALRARASSLPGVEIAAFSHAAQLSASGASFRYQIRIPGSPDMTGDEAIATEQRVTPGFLAAMGTRQIAGRDFSETDQEGSLHVALVNETFVRQFALGTSPVGRRLVKEGGSRKVNTIEIVGVVEDAKWVNLRDEVPAMYYVPYRQQSGSPAVRFAIRAGGDLDVLASGLLGTARALDPQIVLRNVVPFREVVNRTLVVERLVAQVSASFGALALLIAAVGLYGVVAYSVVRRRREIGVRIAVGASSSSVEWMVVRESLVLVGAGIAIGLPAAFFVTRLTSSMLFGLSPGDPTTVVATVTTLATATLAASLVPAHRAAHMDPVVVLRED